MPQDALTPVGYVCQTAELAFLATALRHPTQIGALLEWGLRTEHFSTPAYRQLWILIQQLPPDILDRDVELGRRILLDENLKHEVGVTSWNEINRTLELSTRDQVQWYWDRLEGARLHRQLTRQTADIQARLSEVTAESLVDVKSIANEAASSVSAISSNVNRGALMPIKRAVLEAMDYVEKALEDAQSTDSRLLRWGDEELDRLGHAPRGLITIGGQTSAGKSVLGLQMVDSFLRQGKSGIVFSLEMGCFQVVRRLTTVRGQMMMNDTLNPYGMSEWAANQSSAALMKLAEDSLWINTEANVSIEKIRALARSHHRMHPLDFIMVDYIQIASTDSRLAGDGREAQVSYITLQLKLMSLELDCMVITASQLNDDGKLRESRAIGQHSDVVLNISEEGIWVAKNRDYERNFSLNLYLDGARQRFLPKKP